MASSALPRHCADCHTRSAARRANADAGTDARQPASATLNFEQGFPTEETTRKLFDEIDYQRAVQAYLWAYPAVSFESIRIATKRDLGADLNDMVIADNFADPKGLWLTANDTTIYALANVDLGKSGPVVVEIPPGAIVGMIDDFWQRSIADVGLPGPDGAKGGKFLLLPPGYKGDVPQTGYHVLQGNDEQLQRHGPRHRAERRQGCRRRERQAGQGLSAERKQQPQAEQVRLHVGKGDRHAPADGDGVLGASFGVHQQQPRSGARPVLTWPCSSRWASRRARRSSPMRGSARSSKRRHGWAMPWAA